MIVSEEEQERIREYIRWQSIGIVTTVVGHVWWGLEVMMLQVDEVRPR